MSKVSFSLKPGQSFKAGEILCHLVSLRNGMATICVDAPRSVPITRHNLLVKNPCGEMDHPQGIVERAAMAKA